MDRTELLSRTFVTLADTLVSDFDVVELLDGLVHDAAQILDGSAVGVMLVDQSHQLQVMASSDPRMHAIEVLQLQSTEGPCLAAFHQRSAVHAITADHRGRWPVFVPRALSEGYLAVSAFPMRLREQTIGALNVFRPEPRPLTSADAATAQALADVATIGLVQHEALRKARRLADQLQSALNSRVIIEQAKGILAERAKVSMTDAFLVLRRYCRDTNTGISIAADGLVNGRIAAEDMLTVRKRLDPARPATVDRAP